MCHFATNDVMYLVIRDLGIRAVVVAVGSAKVETIVAEDDLQDLAVGRRVWRHFLCLP